MDNKIQARLDNNNKMIKNPDSKKTKKQVN